MCAPGSGVSGVRMGVGPLSGGWRAGPNPSCEEEIVIPEPVPERTDPSGTFRGVWYASLPVLLLIVAGVVLVLAHYWPWDAR